MNEEPFRHEYKYVCSATQIALLKSRVCGLLTLDNNASTDGQYNIRSLYFDDTDNTCYKENEAGTDPREKFRIRIYNNSSDNISLELKQKEQGMTRKLSCPLTVKQCRTLMSGQAVDGEIPVLLYKLNTLIRTRMMRPAVIVEYDRTPYVYPVGNVRVTFDRNISSSSHIDRFLDDEIPKRPIMPSGQHVLEVKWDMLLPDYIKHSLQINDLQRTAFSKYYICRRYDYRGGIIQ